MVTGASTANVALILVDARNGVVEQTKRHAIIASLLQIPHLVVCINKMDLVGYDKDVFEQVKSDFEEFSARLEIKDVILPKTLQRAMAAEAEATREARAKVIAADGELKASKNLKEASDVISESPAALQLRFLQTLFLLKKTQLSFFHCLLNS